MEQVYFENGKFYTKTNGVLHQIGFSALGGGGSRRVTNNGVDIWTGLNQKQIQFPLVDNTGYYTFFRDIGGLLIPTNGTESWFEYRGGQSLRLSNFSVMASTDSLDTDANVTIRIFVGNPTPVSTPIFVTIPYNIGPTPTVFTDSSNSVIINNGDRIVIQVLGTSQNGSATIWTTTIRTSAV